MRIFSAILLSTGALLLASCAHLAPPLRPDSQPDGKTAILYGRFDLTRKCAFDNKLALWLQNEDNHKSVYIGFDEVNPVFGVQVKPGRYRLMGFIGLNRAHKVEVRKTLSKAGGAFFASPGAEVYIGDFTGQAVWDGDMVFTWRLAGGTNNFAATTTGFRRKYAALGLRPVQSAFAERAK